MFKLFHDKILVKEIEEEAVSSAGILMPAGDDNYKRGEVVEVGPGKYINGHFVETIVKKGDIISFTYGKDYKKDGVVYTLTDEDQVIACIK